MRAHIAICFSILCCLTSFSLAQEKEQNEPALYMKELIHDMGDIHEQTVYKHSFIIENHGKADLIIESVKPG